MKKLLSFIILSSVLAHAQSPSPVATQSPGDSTNKVATTAFVANAVAAITPGGGGTSAINQLLTGGGVAWNSALNFTVSPATYIIAGVNYSSALTSITMTAADATNPRIDAIIVNSSGAVTKVDGTAAPSPAEPSVDPTSQLVLTFVHIAANASTPSNIALTNIYLENTEWTCTASAGTINCASTNNPFAGTKDIEFTAAAANDYVKLVSTPVTMNTFNSLVIHIRSKAAWASQRTLTISFQLSNKAQGNTVVLSQGSFGFDSTNTSAYQLIVIPTAAFGSISTADELRFTVSGKGSSTLGLYLDNIILQSGVSGPTLPTNIMLFRGAWNATTSYNINDVVTNSGIIYVASAANVNSTPPSANWTVAYTPPVLTFECEGGFGDGLNAMAASSFVQWTCVNKTGKTWTIVGAYCLTDNAGTTTLAVTDNSGNNLLSAATITCNATFPGATLGPGATTTLADGAGMKFTLAADGTSKQANFVVALTRAY